MKYTKWLFLLIIPILLMSSCKEENNDILSIEGTWKLNNVSGGLAGINIDYNDGDVNWIFTPTTQKLEVQNNIETDGPEQIYSMFDTGIYDYNIVNENDLEQLYIDGVNVGTITYDENEMNIDQGIAVDGLLMNFIK